MTWIKICGITNLEDALVAVQAGADAIGFVFAESPRRIEPQLAGEIAAQLPQKVEKVGVFVNETAARIRAAVKAASLTAVQLHGDEAAGFAEELFSDLGRQRPHIYRGVSMKTVFSVANVTATLQAHRTKHVFDALLVDSGSSTRGGGTGLTFDWERARPFVTGLKKAGKVIIAGGLTPENVARAIETFHPWGVDVASGVEKIPGKKDPVKVAAFIAAVRGAGVKQR